MLHQRPANAGSCQRTSVVEHRLVAWQTPMRLIPLLETGPQDFIFHPSKILVRSPQNNDQRGERPL